MTTRRRSPREDKELDYERQHFSSGKYDKAFRRQWPRKKARAERTYRHKVTQMLTRNNVNDAEENQTDTASLKRETIRKWSIGNLRDRVQGKLEKRQQMVGARKERRRRNSQQQQCNCKK